VLYKDYDSRLVDVELIPAQEPEIEAVIAEAMASRRPAAPDPWWQAGIDEALET
jgi:hypothetical protein